MRSYVADFETTTNKENCHVWGWAMCEVEDLNNVYIGTNIDSFFQLCEDFVDNVKVYFHNLKFDGQFIISWLFENGFKHVSDPKDRASNTFTTMISDKGLYYCIEVIFYLKGKKVKKVTFWDSLKVIPLSVEEIADTFQMPFKKLKIDYAAHNDLPYDSPMTDEEKAYLINDVKIVASALAFFHSQGLNKMTIGGCALNEYMNMIGKNEFKRWFPIPQYHDDVKQSYRGGFTYLNPKFKEKTVGKGVVLDVNSMFPFVMKTKLLPFGTPVFYKGQYMKDDIYPLYTQMIRCQFELKKGKIPMIQIKKSLYYSGNEYLTSSNDEIVPLCLNSVDLELFLENYDVYNLEYVSGWKFKATTGLFNDYIEKWNNIKIQAKKDKNWGLYLIAKLYLNSLYGKFGTGNENKSKIPYVDNEGVIHYKDADPEAKDSVYIPIASFITSYARDIIVRAAQKITDDYNAGKSKLQFIYCDTDSLHILSPDFSLPEGLYINQTELGAFKFESKFRKGKFLRQKCYIEDSTEDIESDKPEYNLKITVAGMPLACHEDVTFNNFKIGAVYKGKKQPQIVKGGVILKDIDFTIKK